MYNTWVWLQSSSVRDLWPLTYIKFSKFRDVWHLGLTPVIFSRWPLTYHAKGCNLLSLTLVIFRRWPLIFDLDVWATDPGKICVVTKHNIAGVHDLWTLANKLVFIMRILVKLIGCIGPCFHGDIFWNRKKKTFNSIKFKVAGQECNQSW